MVLMALVNLLLKALATVTTISVDQSSPFTKKQQQQRIKVPSPSQTSSKQHTRTTTSRTTFASIPSPSAYVAFLVAVSLLVRIRLSTYIILSYSDSHSLSRLYTLSSISPTISPILRHYPSLFRSPTNFVQADHTYHIIR